VKGLWTIAYAFWFHLIWSFCSRPDVLSTSTEDSRDRKLAPIFRVENQNRLMERVSC